MEEQIYGGVLNDLAGQLKLTSVRGRKPGPVRTDHPELPNIAVILNEQGINSTLGLCCASIGHMAFLNQI